MPSVHGHFYDVAADVYGALVAAVDLAATNDASYDAPDRRVLTAGEWTADPCDALVVSRKRVGPIVAEFMPTAVVMAGASINVQVDAYLLRCVPNLDEDGSAPSTAEMLASAQLLGRDADLLWFTVWNGLHDRTLLDGCRQAEVAEMVPYGPEGNVGGSVLSLMVTL